MREPVEKLKWFIEQVGLKKPRDFARFIGHWYAYGPHEDKDVPRTVDHMVDDLENWVGPDQVRPQEHTSLLFFIGIANLYSHVTQRPLRPHRLQDRSLQDFIQLFTPELDQIKRLKAEWLRLSAAERRHLLSASSAQAHLNTSRMGGQNR